MIHHTQIGVLFAQQMVRALYGLRHLLAALCAALLLASHAQAFDVLGGATNNAPAVPGTAAPATGDTVQTEQVQVQLLLHAPQGWQPQAPVQLGLHIKHQPGWHTYWQNAGDSGSPTQVQYTLPAGSSAGAIAWPVPHKIPVGDMANYGYEGDVLLASPVTVTQAAPAGAPITLHAKWLVCRVECLPQSGNFVITVPEGASSPHAALFMQAAARVPQPAAGMGQLAVGADGQTLTLQLPASSLPPDWVGQPITTYAASPLLIQHAAAGQQSWADKQLRITWPINEGINIPYTDTDWVLEHGGKALHLRASTQGGAAAWQQVAAYTRNLQNAQLSPELAAALAANAHQQAQAASSAPPSQGLPWALLLAFVGGMILNLMPCVFPVLAIKVLGFLNTADARTRRAGALSYALGVVLSFVALAALLLLLRAAGAALGWGFQLQSSVFVACLAALFVVLALNMSGVFELKQVLPQRWLQAEARHPLLDHFLSGVLAVAVASPCTAPFMGAALGYALAQSPAQALLVFTALGLGMALPYVVLSYWPRLAQHLPRPGAWMNTFKKLLAIPLWLTVAWLVWVYQQQRSSTALLLLVGALALLAIGIVLLRNKRLAAGVLALLAAGACLVYASTTTTPRAAVSATPSSNWQPWSAARVAQARAQGQAVFIDFTAAWCVSCQYNKKTVLERDDVQQAFARKQMLLLRADWTNYDPAITQALQALGRSGVPVYVLIDAQGKSTLLPELLTPGIVHKHLDALSAPAP